MRKSKQQIFMGIFFKDKADALIRAGKMEAQNGIEYGIGTCNGGYIVLSKENLNSVRG